MKPQRQPIAMFMARQASKKKVEDKDMDHMAEGGLVLDPNEEDSLDELGDELFREEDEFGMAPEEVDEETDKAKSKKKMFAQQYMIHRSMR